jgi:peptidoglycan/LPS O-acetylase OafA/YrhL
LTYSVLKKGVAPRTASFLTRRLGRLLPEWWFVHLLFVAAYLLIGYGLQPTAWQTAASFLGVRFLPGTMYYFAPAWWFVGLILQFYLLFPLLIRFVQRGRPFRRIILLISVGIMLRAIGLLLFDGLLDWWSRGALFVSRLPDFAAGMLLAYVMVQRPELLMRLTRGLRGVALWFAVWMFGNVASFFLVGMAVAFLFTGVGLFVLLYMATREMAASTRDPLQWLGRNSLSVFLMHHPVLSALVPSTLSLLAVGRVTVFLLVTLILSVVFAVFVRELAGRTAAVLNRWYRHRGLGAVVLRTGGVLGAFVGLVLLVEVGVRVLAPQEVLGWGERPSLLPDDELGYKLKPNSTTRLRWLSYDYVVTANALGFPGPLYSRTRSADSFRIMVTGDAFESAEGVDTHEAWPRVMEEELRQTGVEAEVMNFSITGWGPQHYARAVSRYASVYAPDLIVVGFFVNEFFDVERSDENFNRSIGFDQPEQGSTYAIVSLAHSRALAARLLKGKLKAVLLGGSYRHGEFLANLAAVDRQNRARIEDNATQVSAYLGTIRERAAAIDAELLVVLVPAPVQVCKPPDLRYFPPNVDLSDRARWDMDQPQDIAFSMLDGLGIRAFDLRPVLAEKAECPYQPRNMHWTESGHYIVARALADKLGSGPGDRRTP